jgi:hypothetical protein
MLDLETTNRLLVWYSDNLYSFIITFSVLFISLKIQEYISYERIYDFLHKKGGVWLVVAYMIVINIPSLLAIIILVSSIVTFFVLKLNQVVLLNQVVFIEVMSKPEFIPFAMLLSGCFYWLKRRSPLFYGLLELFVAMISIWSSVLIQTDNLFAKTLSLLGGIYIFVRGLDNINKGVPASFERVWSFIFGPSERGAAAIKDTTKGGHKTR